MIAAALLIKDGITPDDALNRISEARGLPVPETPEQREWVKEFARRRLPQSVPPTRVSVR